MAIRTGITLALVGLAGLLTVTPSQAARRFSGYVACGQSDPGYRAPAKHNCYIGDLPYADFIDRRRSGTRYRKCVTVPDGQRYCAWHRTGAAGKLSQRPLHVEQVGTVRVQWYVGGRQVRDWHFYMHTGD
jgi:hypothetical protein